MKRIKRDLPMTLIFCSMFIFIPPIILVFGADKEWLVRFIILLVLLPVGTLLCFLYALNLKTQMISPGGKIKRGSGASKRVKRLDIACRVFFVALAIVLLIGVVVPFVIDSFSIATIHRQGAIKATIKGNGTPFGMWFMSQSIWVEDEHGEKSKYFLLYSAKPRLKRGKEYEFLVMPRSKLVLEAREVE